MKRTSATPSLNITISDSLNDNNAKKRPFISRTLVGLDGDLDKVTSISGTVTPSSSYETLVGDLDYLNKVFTANKGNMDRTRSCHEIIIEDGPFSAPSGIHIAIQPSVTINSEKIHSFTPRVKNKPSRRRRTSSSDFRVEKEEINNSKITDLYPSQNILSPLPTNSSINFGLLNVEDVTNRYNILDVNTILGKGSYSIVESAISKITGFDVALKRISKEFLFTPQEKTNVLREIHLHQRFTHRNIVRMHEAFETEKEVILAFDLCDEGHLREFIRNNYHFNSGLVPEEDACHIMRNLIEGLIFLHQVGVLHGDIKPDNILFYRKKKITIDSKKFNIKEHGIKICDFGLARSFPSSYNKRMTGNPNLCPHSNNLGTKGYLAPELLQKKPYSAAVDIWGLGILFYEMLFGYLPFDSLSQSSVNNLVMFDTQYTSHVSGSVKEIIKKMLNPICTERPNAKDLLEILPAD